MNTYTIKSVTYHIVEAKNYKDAIAIAYSIIENEEWSGEDFSYIVVGSTKEI